MKEVEEDLIVPVKHFKCGEKNRIPESSSIERKDDDYEENLDLDAPFVEETPKPQSENTEANGKEEDDTIAEAITTADQTANDIPSSKTDAETQPLDGTDKTDFEDVNPDEENEQKSANHLKQQPDQQDEDDEVQSNASEDLLADVSPETLEADDSEVAEDNNDSSKVVEPEKQSTMEEEEYEEEYVGATQLFDSEDKNEEVKLDDQVNKNDCHKASIKDTL